MVVLGCWVSHVVIGKTCVVQLSMSMNMSCKWFFLWQGGLQGWVIFLVDSIIS